MRCNNCGWDNQDSAAVCIKCNTKLEKSKADTKQSQTADNQFGKTMTDNQVSPVAEKNDMAFEKTILENSDSLSIDNDIQKDILIPCSNSDCGYLNPGDAVICAKCKTPIVNKAAGAKASAEAKAPATIAGQPQVVKESFSGTIDPYRENNKIIACFLEPVLRSGEKNQFDVPGGARGFFDIKFTLDNNPVELNRGNLDKDNITITSKVQAELYFENGKWLLLDRSELNTTFILAKQKTELHEGDVILMGDRKFIFSTIDKSR
jgi:hypothetical protein